MVLSEALVEAARAGDVATVEQWLNSGGDANERCATSGRTLLHVIASDRLRSDEVERGRCDIARLLLARGAEVDAKRIHPSLPQDARGGEDPVVAGPPRPGRPPRLQVLAGQPSAPGETCHDTRERVRPTPSPRAY